jgi:2,3-bisphosphoglycerate-independent phosphoglycerate mutase
MNPFVLLIVDGWGVASAWGGNAVLVAKTPIMNYLWQKSPRALLGASEQSVGLPKEERGNSEVGHLNIGSGRVVHQDLPSITANIEDGSFFRNPVILKTFNAVKERNSQLHLIGLASNGGIHSHINHLFALLEMAKKEDVKEVIIHIITDGRDTAPTEALRFIGMVEAKIKEIGCGIIGSVAGRFYAMDRENKWERIETFYRLLTEGVGRDSLSATAAISDAYRNGQSDEFVMPTVIRDNSQTIKMIKDNDGIIFFNFRGDRAREITEAIIKPDFNKFNRAVVRKNLLFTTFTSYQEGLPVQVAFSPEKVHNPLASVLSIAGLEQLHMAETAKYPHVTHFFNGGIEEPFPGEERIMIPSPNVNTYDRKPEMSANEVTNTLISKLNKFPFSVVNLANLDMVGHTGNIRATVKAVESVDFCLGRIIQAVKQANGSLVITADHGNAEQMINPETGDVDTEHTTNPVPFFFMSWTGQNAKIKPSGILADIAPTILDFMGRPIPEEMSGKSLIIRG